GNADPAQLIHAPFPAPDPAAVPDALPGHALRAAAGGARRGRARRRGRRAGDRAVPLRAHVSSAAAVRRLGGLPARPRAPGLGARRRLPRRRGRDPARLRADARPRARARDGRGTRRRWRPDRLLALAALLPAPRLGSLSHMVEDRPNHRWWTLF